MMKRLFITFTFIILLTGMALSQTTVRPAGTVSIGTSIIWNRTTDSLYMVLTGTPVKYYNIGVYGKISKQLSDSINSVNARTDSSFVGKTAGILGTGSASGRSYNINTSPNVNTIASDVQAVVNLAPGRPHDPNIIGSTTGTGADLAYILAGYDNVVDGLMSGIIGAHNRINVGTTHGSINGGSYHIWNGNNAYSASAGGTVDSLTNVTYSFFGGGQNNKGVSSSYGSVFGNTNSVTNQTNFHISGVNSVLTGASNVLNNAIYSGRLDTISGAGYSAIVNARSSSIKNGNYNYIAPGFTNRIGTTATVNYSHILGGTLNVNNGTNSTIVNGTSNSIPSGLSNVYILGTGITAAASGTTYVDALNAKNLTASAPVFTDANKKLVSTGVVPTANGGAGTINGILKANGSGVVSLAVAGTDYATPAAVALKQNLVTLTTTGTSGAATFNQSTGALNIPNYATGTTYPISVKSADYTLTSSDYTIVTGTSSTTYTLPAAASVTVGKTFVIKNFSSGSITVATTGTQLKWDAGSFVTPVASLTGTINGWILQTDGTYWYLISGF